MASPKKKKQRRDKAAKVSANSVIGGIRSSSSSSDEEEGGAKWVYLVLRHAVICPAYSLFKVDPHTDGHGTPAPIPRRITRLKAKQGMTFVPVRSKHGSWILGVGGDHGNSDYGPETIIFDTKTQEVIQGPDPEAIKLFPALIPMGEKVYALSGCITMVPGEPGFSPWFEVLDLSEANVVDGRLENCYWRSLWPPLLFNLCTPPTRPDFLPEFTVQSCVAVGSYILLSWLERTGTQAFNTETGHWQRVDDKNLPFSDYAVPHGGLFLGRSRANSAITAYRIKVCPPSPSSEVTGANMLSITEFPIKSHLEGAIGGFGLLSLGSSEFCVLSFWTEGWDPVEKAFIRLRTYQMEDPMLQESMESEEELDVKSEIAVSNRWDQVYKVRDSSRGLCSLCLGGALHI